MDSVDSRAEQIGLTKRMAAVRPLVPLAVRDISGRCRFITRHCQPLNANDKDIAEEVDEIEYPPFSSDLARLPNIELSETLAVSALINHPFPWDNEDMPNK